MSLVVAPGVDASSVDWVEALLKILPKCADGVEGPCVEVPNTNGDRGVAVYGENQRMCMNEILLPGFNMLPRALLGFIYLLFLLWLFSGVAIASDMFMAGIEVITSTTRKAKRKTASGEVVVVDVPVWNWVVANISLMALGTSAPEILLATVETCITLGKPAGELGPSCIVGSAAYNSLVITAVCTLALPVGTFKRIAQLRVFWTTCCWSVWAYIWMLVVYQWWTPDEVTIAEAFITLGFFGLMLITAWLVDTEPWKKDNRVVDLPTKDPESLEEAKALPPPEKEDPHPHTLAHYRQILAQRAGNVHKKFHSQHSMQRGGRRLSGTDQNEIEGHHDGVHASLGSQGAIVPLQPQVPKVLVDPTKTTVAFRSRAYSVLESAKVAKLTVTRVGGDLQKTLRVAYKTQDDDAVAGLDYKAVEGFLTFHAGESSKVIEVPIIDDDMSEPDVSFTVHLELGDSHHHEALDAADVLLPQPMVRVTIIDDDDAGVLGFELPDYEVSFNANHPVAELNVVRRRGRDGQVEVEYETQDETAFAGKDYIAVAGKLTFEAGEASQPVRVTLLSDGSPQAELHKRFHLVLKSPSGGAELSNRSTCNVTMVQRDLTLLAGQPVLAAVAITCKPGIDNAVAKAAKGSGSGSSASDASDGGSGRLNLWDEWVQQIKDALSVPEPEEEDEDLGWGDYVLQYVNITWKLILGAVIPPPHWYSGYPCFLAALGCIVGVVYLVEAAATLFGCIVGLKDLMTGISLVALGTSLPDTLASRIAAVKDKDADAAIGNITGSNSVNVFLGLGLPWVIGSCYYTAKGEKYVTPAGDLSFSIMLFAIFQGVYLVVLMFRRYQGGELGGSRAGQWGVSSLYVGMWILYLILVGLRSYGHL